MTDIPVMGWRHYAWRKPRRRCARCKRKRLSGVIGLAMMGREADPAFRFLCDECYSGLDET